MSFSFFTNTLSLAFSFSAEIIWSFIKNGSLELPLRVVILLLETIAQKHENLPKGNPFGMRNTTLVQISSSPNINWLHTDFPVLCFVPTFCQWKEEILQLGLSKTEGTTEGFKFFSLLQWKKVVAVPCLK